MKNKRILPLLFCLVLLIGALSVLSACSQKKCTEHTFGDWQTTTAPTCTTAGVRTHTCTKCGEAATEEIAATGHTPDREAATCTEDKTCTVCNTVIEAKHHTPDREAATCTEDKTCSVCHTVIEAKKGHTPDREAATCTEDKTCTVCNTVIEAKKGHSLSSTGTVTPPTCTEEGYTTVACANCTYTEKIDRKPAKGHTPDRDKATCANAKVCTVCEAVLEQKKNHSYTAGDPVAATCTEAGYVMMTCGGCNDSYKATTAPATGHTVSAWTETARTKKTGETCVYEISYKGHCTACDTDVTKTEEQTIHAFEARVTLAATCTTAGKKTLTCKDCNASGGTQEYTDTAAHKWNDGVKSGNVITYTCEHNAAHTKTAIDATSNTDATVGADDLTNAGGIKLDGAEMQLDDTVKDQLGSGEITVSAGTLNATEKENALTGLTAAQKEAIGESKIYNFGLKSGGDAIDFNGGKITVTIPYTLAEGEDPETIAIWYIDAEGNVRSYKATYANGYATFEADHFSYYTVARLTPAERCALYGHSDLTTTVAQTCTQDGCKLLICRRCGRIERTDVQPATGHEMDEGTETAATCTKDGKIVYKCVHEGCSYSYDVKIPALGHSFKLDDKTSYAATCVKAGSSHYVCGNGDCTADYTVALPMLGHSMTERTVASTCTEDGYTLHACRNCDYAYKTDIVAAHHTFDIDAPTCGRGQVCTVCGAAGLAATGEHTLVNGVCSVCGQGCAHTYTDKVVAPTCTEAGYTEHTCSKCENTVRDTYVKATGHQYENGVCTVCDEKLELTELYYQIRRSLKTEKYTFLAKDIKLVVYDFDLDDIVGGIMTSERPYAMILADTDEEDDPMIDLAIEGELYFGFDENGEIYGYVVGSLAGTVGSEGSAEVICLLREGKLYIDARTTEPYNSAQFYYIDLVTAQGAADSSTQTTMMAINSVMDILKWYNDTLKPFLLAADDKNADKIAASTERLLTLLFTMEDDEDGGYVFSFSADKLHDIFDLAAEKKYSEFYDLMYGEGSYAALKTEIPALLNMTFGDLFDAMAEAGYDVNDLIDLVDALLAKGTVIVFADTPITSLDMLFSYLMGEEIDVKELLANEQLRETVIADLLLSLIKDFAGIELSRETILAMLDDSLTALGNVTLYEYIAGLMMTPSDGATEEEQAAALAAAAATLKEQTDAVLEVLCGMADFGFTVDKEGTVLDWTLDLNIDLDGIYTLIGKITAIKDYESDVELDDTVKAAEQVVLNPHSADGEPAYILVFDDAGKLVSVTYKDIYFYSGMIEWQQIKDDYWANAVGDAEPESIILRYSQSVEEGSYKMKDLFAASIEADCGKWVSVRWSFAAGVVTEYTQSVVATFKASDIKTLLGVSALSDLIIYENASEILASDLARTETVTDGTKKTENGRYNNLSFCYNTETKAITDEYSMHKTKDEYAFATEVKDCEAGVLYKTVCENCGEVISSGTRKWHDTNYVTERIDLSTYGCRMDEIVYRNCFCGKTGSVYINGSYYATTGESGETIYRCADENCTVQLVEKETVTVDGCKISTAYTYTLKVNGTDAKTLSFTREEMKHTALTETYKLVDGADSCTDGVNITETCSACGYASTRKAFYHATYTIEAHDFSEYGAKCGGSWGKTNCACGQNPNTYIKRESAMEWISMPELETGDCTDAYIYTCAVTDCGFTILYKTFSVHDKENCKKNCRTEAYFGWDRETGNYKASTVTSTWSYASHTLSWTNETDEDALTRTAKCTCAYCDYEEIVVSKYRTHDGWAVSADGALEWQTSTVCYDEDEDLDVASQTIRTEYFETDGKEALAVQLLGSYIGDGIKTITTTTTYWNGITSEEKYVVEFDFENCRYRIYEMGEDYTADKGWMSFHEAYDFDRLITVVVDTKPQDGSCTATGTMHLKCALCGKHVAPFDSMGNNKYFSFPDGDLYGTAENRYYRVMTTAMINSDALNDYRNGYGTFYINPASYDAADGTFKFAVGHCYEYQNEIGVYACTKCGLVNGTGADAVAILEDLTDYPSASETLPSAFKVRYLPLYSGALSAQLSFVIEGEMVIYPEEGEYAAMYTGFRSEDYVTFNSDGTVTVDCDKLCEFLADLFMKEDDASELEEADEDAASEGYSFYLRLNFVPVGGRTDLECAITFDSLIEIPYGVAEETVAA